MTTVCKNDLKCKQHIVSSLFSSFEINLFEVSCFDPVFCIVIYRLPEYNKDFVNDFSGLLEIMPNYDHTLFLEDFNLHVCCADKPLVKDFLSLIDSFNLVQWVSGPTHWTSSSLLVYLCL